MRRGLNRSAIYPLESHRDWDRRAIPNLWKVLAKDSRPSLSVFHLRIREIEDPRIVIYFLTLARNVLKILPSFFQRWRLRKSEIRATHIFPPFLYPRSRSSSICHLSMSFILRAIFCHSYQRNRTKKRSITQIWRNLSIYSLLLSKSAIYYIAINGI